MPGSKSGNVIRVWKDREFKNVWVFHCAYHVDTCGCCTVQRFGETWQSAFDQADQHRREAH